MQPKWNLLGSRAVVRRSGDAYLQDVQGGMLALHVSMSLTREQHTLFEIAVSPQIHCNPSSSPCAPYGAVWNITCILSGMVWAQYGAVLRMSCALSSISNSHHINTASQRPSATASTVFSTCRCNASGIMPEKSNLCNIHTHPIILCCMLTSR